jgi:hypothetical protein
VKLYKKKALAVIEYDPLITDIVITLVSIDLRLRATVCFMNNSRGCLFHRLQAAMQFLGIKHHLKPTWITIWLPEDRSCQKNPPLTSPTAAISNCSNLAPLYLVWPKTRNRRTFRRNEIAQPPAGLLARLF